MAVELIGKRAERGGIPAEDIDDLNTMFIFFEEREASTGTCCSDGVPIVDEEEENDEGEDEIGSSRADRKAFWESQQQALKAALSRTSSLEQRILKETEQALADAPAAGSPCVCPKRLLSHCRFCLLSDVSNRLRKAGYDSAICRSKWRRFHDLPSGEHCYIDVMWECSATTSSREKPSSSSSSPPSPSSPRKRVRVVIELDFRAEFEMARSNREYGELVGRLPQMFVGKEERLSHLIKILCGAAKKCLKEKRMHMGPWRKYQYMQAKWLGACDRIVPAAHDHHHHLQISPALAIAGSASDRERKIKKLRASMLSFDAMPSATTAAVEVV